MGRYFVHDIDGRGMRPEAVVDRGKCNASPLTKERGQHHVARVKRVDKVGWKRVTLFRYVGSPSMEKN